MVAKDYSKDKIIEDKNVEDEDDLQFAEKKRGLGVVGNVIHL